MTTPGEDGYEVRHALLREVIDADLLPGERARLHARLAQTLTEQPELADGSPAVAAAELAAHWDAAGEPTRALPARVEAGLAAEDARAFPEAQRHYERALELWEQVTDPGRAAGMDRVELLTRAAEAAGSSGQADRAAGAADRGASASSTRPSTRSGRRCCTCGSRGSAGIRTTSRAAWPPSRRRCGSCRPSRRPSGPASWASTRSG